MANERRWSVQSMDLQKTIEDVVSDIDKGMKGIGGIRLKPFYQREYKFTQEKESSIIESLLLDIPIPIIQLSSDSRSDVMIYNVIDGQHRLKAIYRFFKDEYKLKGLELYKELYEDINGLKFSELPFKLKNKLLGQCTLYFKNTVVEDNPKLELEIFTRYNQGTNPLKPHEMRSVIFHSELNEWFNNIFIDEIVNDLYLSKIFNARGGRITDKTLHENIYIMLGIHEFGLQTEFNNSYGYADMIMEHYQKLKGEALEIKKQEIRNYIDLISKFFIQVQENNNIEYPFSVELAGRPRKADNKFVLRIAMVFASVFRYIQENNLWGNDSEKTNQLFISMQKGLRNANFHLQGGGGASTTSYTFQKEGYDKVLSAFDNILLK